MYIQGEEICTCIRRNVAGGRHSTKNGRRVFPFLSDNDAIMYVAPVCMYVRNVCRNGECSLYTMGFLCAPSFSGKEKRWSQ